MPEIQTFEKVPTVELHRHWEAGISPQTIATLAQRNRVENFTLRSGAVIDGVDPQNPDSIRAYADRIATGFRGPKGFENFFNAFRSLHSIFKRPGDLEFAIYEQLRKEQAAGSIHTELRGSPISVMRQVGLKSVEEVILAMQRGVDKAYKDFGMSGTIIACFSREKGIGDGSDMEKDQARHVVEAVVKLHNPDRPIGLDIAGAPENKYPPAIFEQALKPLRKAGVPVTIHAGEQCKPPDFSGAPASFVRDAILNLGAKRIGHGVSLMDDSKNGQGTRKLINHLGVGIEACPVSNELMGIIGIDNHPVKGLLDQGLLVSLGTDDPLFFGVASVREMLVKFGARMGLTPQDALEMTRNAIKTAFVSDERREELWKKLDERCVG